MTSVNVKKIEDKLAWYGDCAVHADGTRRLFYYDKFSKLFRRYGFSDQKGLVASYKEIAEFLAMMTYAKDQDDTGEFTDIQKPRPLNCWDAETWMAAHDAIKQIHDQLLRHDANFTLEQLVDEDQGDLQNLELADESAFSIGLSKLSKYFLFHSCLSPFRKTIETIIQDDMGKMSLSEPLVVSDEFLREYRKAVASCKDGKIRKEMSLLLNSERNAFRSTDDIIQLLNDPEKIFSYQKLMQRTDSLLRQWKQLALRKPRSTVRYSSIGDAVVRSKQRHNEGIRHLQESRARLSKQVVDPLPDAAAMAKKARRLLISSSVSLDVDETGKDIDDVIKERSQSRKRKFLDRKPSAIKEESHNNEQKEAIDETDEFSVSIDDDDDEDYIEGSERGFENIIEIQKGKFLEHKKSATRVDFQSESDEEIIEEWDRRDRKKAQRILKGTTMPAGEKSRKSQQKAYEGRRTWTETEIYAIKEGIAAFGWGKWAQIKDYYSAILKNRTSSQIKDKVRTMKNNGELDGMKRLHEQYSRSSKQVVHPLPDAASMARKARRLRISSSVSPDVDDTDEDDTADEDNDEVCKERNRSRKRNFLDRKPSATRDDFQNNEEKEIIDETDESFVSLDDDNDEDYSEDSDRGFDGRMENQRGKVLEQKELATGVDLQSDGEGDIIEERDEGDPKSDPWIPKGTGKPKKSRKSQQKTYEGRRLWTEIEIYAIKEGIAAFGWGNWAQIKDYYSAILKNRTSSQIKDKVRTMKSNGELN